MLMSVKQYAILFGLLIVILISVFAYNISSNLDITHHKIEASQQASAITELEHAITLTLDNVRQSADKISQWQEVKQQLNNPEIFAYWYNVRLKQFVFDLQKYMLDLMIYGFLKFQVQEVCFGKKPMGTQGTILLTEL